MKVPCLLSFLSSLQTILSRICCKRQTSSLKVPCLLSFLSSLQTILSRICCKRQTSLLKVPRLFFNPSNNSFKDLLQKTNKFVEGPSSFLSSLKQFFQGSVAKDKQVCWRSLVFSFIPQTILSRICCKRQTSLLKVPCIFVHLSNNSFKDLLQKTDEFDGISEHRRVGLAEKSNLSSATLFWKTTHRVVWFLFRKVLPFYSNKRPTRYFLDALLFFRYIKTHISKDNYFQGHVTDNLVFLLFSLNNFLTIRNRRTKNDE